jgi:hypothetical protein
VLGEAVTQVLREDDLFIRGNGEFTSRARLDRCVETEALADRGRETRGLWLVASGRAVTNQNCHCEEA